MSLDTENRWEGDEQNILFANPEHHPEEEEENEETGIYTEHRDIA